MKHVIQTALALVFASSGTFALGQTIYKLQQADGRTVYSDKVLPKTRVQKEITDRQSELSVVAPPAPSQVAENQATAQLAKRDQLWRERESAQSDLDAARRAKAQGEEPLPGERIGTASRHSRLNNAYWARQDSLDRGIEAAQRRLERAEQGLRAAGG